MRKATREAGHLNGILPVDKPAGPTSHDIVALARRELHERRIGHTGTLDPFASGLLLLCVGAATRLAEYLSGPAKRYTAVARLGRATDTDDATGVTSSESANWRSVERARIEEAFQRLVGRVPQRPPTYSAKHVGGERSHRLARRGQPVRPAAVAVEIYAIELVELDLPDVHFTVECASGTYVRAIARDFGEALGTGAHLVALRRTAIGVFAVEDAVAAASLADPEAVRRAWIDPLAALAHLPSVEVNGAARQRIAHGAAVADPHEAGSAAPAVVVAHDGQLIAVAERRDGMLLPRKVFLHD
ncbi:MAG: tRNA pseudouridine(55) synthase TruB [Longimicrobiales bacterium]